MLNIIATRKSSHVVATAYAEVKVEGTHTRSEVIDAGLEALGERRSSLWGYGIVGFPGRTVVDQEFTDITVTVYAERD